MTEFSSNDPERMTPAELSYYQDALAVIGAAKGSYDHRLVSHYMWAKEREAPGFDASDSEVQSLLTQQDSRYSAVMDVLVEEQHLAALAVARYNKTVDTAAKVREEIEHEIVSMLIAKNRIASAPEITTEHFTPKDDEE